MMSAVSGPFESLKVEDVEELSSCMIGGESRRAGGGLDPLMYYRRLSE